MITPDFYHQFQNVEFLTHAIKGGSYFGIFLLSIVVSYGVLPIPEAVFLLLVGFVAQKMGMNIAVVMTVSILGMIIGDNIVYRLSFFGNKWVERLNQKVRKHKLIKYEHLVADNVGATVYFLKFVAGVRFFGPVILGSLKADWKKFFVHNIIASIVHTSILIFIGYYFHQRILSVMAEVEIVKNVLLFFSAVIVGVLITVCSKKTCVK